jgi:predicted PhzF superfamily epimerase YddE/YHI9
MARYAFRIVNVFTVDGDRFSGNPLCVFEDARGLSTEQMQSLARQMNLSETTFVLPSTSATAHVLIFTPGYEMPFAGHPTLGTAFVVGGASITFEMKAGLVPVTRDGDTLMLKAAHGPKTREVDASRLELARMLSLPDDAISGEPLWVNTGVEQLVIPVANPKLVEQAKPVLALIEKHGFSETRQEAMAYLWSPDDPNDSWLMNGQGQSTGRDMGRESGRDMGRESGRDIPVTVRFFFTSNGAVLEDPATGSACANLGGYLIANGRTPVKATLRQGAAVSRPSRLGLRVDEAGGIFVSGAAIELGRGHVEL